MDFIFAWGKFSRKRQNCKNYPHEKISMSTVYNRGAKLKYRGMFEKVGNLTLKLCILTFFIFSGNAEVVEKLLKLGSDQSLKMGDLSVQDIARDFGPQRSPAALLQEMSVSS